MSGHRLPGRLILFALLLAIGISACGGTNQSSLLNTAGGPDQAADADRTPPQFEAAPAALPELGAPSQIARGISVTEYDVDRLGREYEAGLPSSNIAPLADSLVFTPAESDALSSMAYAMYLFSLDGLSGPAELQTHWDGIAPASGTLWLGLADWQSDRWRWYSAEDGERLLAAIDGFLRESDGALLCTVLLTEGTPARLDEIAIEVNLPAQVVSVVPLSALVNSEVQFSAEVIGSGEIAYQWFFGGAALPGTSSEASPTVMLTGTAGTHPMLLTVENDYGEKDFFYFDFEIENSPAEVVSVTPLAGKPGEIVQFSAEVEGLGPISFYWNFGGGATPNLAYVATPYVTLGAEGIYNGVLVVDNDYGPTSSFQFQYEVGLVPVEVLSVSPTTVPELSTVTMNAVVNGSGPLTYAWDFGGAATPETSAEAAPEIQVGSPGSYDCSVTIDNEFGPPDTFPFTLTVTSGAPLVESVSPLNVAEFSEVTFTAEAEGTEPFSYVWNFGGGATPNTSTDAAPTVTMGENGTYNGVLILSNIVGPPDVFEFQLEVGAYPAVVLDVEPTFAGEDEYVQFIADVSGTAPLSYNWNFGGGAIPDTSTDASPYVLLPEAGDFSAVLTVDNDFGPADVFEFTLEVGSTAPQIWSVSPTRAETGKIKQFTAHVGGTGPFSYTWYFGGGAEPNLSTEASPSVTLQEEGAYNAMVSIDGPFGEPAIYEFPLQILEQGQITTQGWGTASYDMQRSRRSDEIGPQTGHIEWVWESDNPSRIVCLAPAVDEQNNVYFGRADDKFICVTNSGGTQWAVPLNLSTGHSETPSIDQDGNIYTSGFWLTKFSPTGEKFWEIDEWLCAGESAIGTNGLIYQTASSPFKLMAIEPDGDLAWDSGDLFEEIPRGAPVVLPDGTVYCGAADGQIAYFTGDGNLIRSIDLGDDIYSSYLAGADGTLFISSNGPVATHALLPDGSFRWSITDSVMGYGGLIGADGALLVHTSQVNEHNAQTGERTGFEIHGGEGYIIGGDGTIYYKYGMLHALRPDGTMKWSLDLGEDIYEGSLALGRNGRLYYLARAGRLYAIQDE